MLFTDGVCGIGLKCLVRFSVERDSLGIKEENSAVGTCVPENSKLCPGPDVLTLEDGVNCRPGRLGILSEALYCPNDNKTITEQKKVNKTKDKQTAVATTADEPPPATGAPPGLFTPPPNAPTLIQLILSNIPQPFQINLN